MVAAGAVIALFLVGAGQLTRGRRPGRGVRALAPRRLAHHAVREPRIGCLAFFLESSMKIMDVYTAAFFVMSGYLIPPRALPGEGRPRSAISSRSATRSACRSRS